MELKDPYFGEALFHAYQGHYFEALQRLDAEMAQHHGVDEPQLDSLYPHVDHAEFSVGDFELHYRMHHRAGRAVKAILEADVAEPVRNEAVYRLARIHFHKRQPENALRVLEDIHGDLPEGVRDDVEFLRANVLMALGRAPDAVDVLRRVQSSEDLKGFSTFNLGIALLRADRFRDAIRELDKAGRVKGRQRETLAIRDKANFVLGTLLLESSEFELAQRFLDRVRLEGPFSNRALLGAGWADASAENFGRAVVPWSILAERDATDGSVQEAMLALPYAYSKLSVHGRAAVLYERAAKIFGHELVKVDASIRSIRNGEFLKALAREEIRQDRDWVIRLRSLPEAPETFYLVALMASHDFQTALQNYLDLEDLRRKLASWHDSLDAFEDITRLRRAYYEPLIPDIDRRFRQLDAQIRLRLEQRKHLHQRLQQMLTAPRPNLLATSSEQGLEARLDQLEAGLGDASGSAPEALRIRIQRLSGVLIWRLETQYHHRLTGAHAHLRELNSDVEKLTAQYDSFVRTRQAAVHGYAGYQSQIDGLRARVGRALEGIDVLIPRQGHVLESVAIRELAARRERLEAYQSKARFAFADSYDRAVKSQIEAQ
jgi:Flp pilus assembly protein TadD